MKTQELLELSGLTQRQLTHWSDVISPEIEAPGKGNHREWDQWDLRVAKILKSLLWLGLERSIVTDVLLQARRMAPDDVVRIEAGRVVVTVRV